MSDWSTVPCRETDPEVFFAVYDLTAIKQARAICARCPLIQQCLDEAMATRQQFGIWGGLTPAERRRMHRAAARLQRGAA